MLITELIPAGLTVERLWPVALGILFVAYLTKEIRSYLRLSHFPTPSWICGFSSLWQYQVEMSGRNYLYWEEACEKYGKIVRVAPNILVTSDEELMRRMTAIRSPYVRDEWFKAIRFDADKENILSEIGPALPFRLLYHTLTDEEQIQRSMHSCEQKFRTGWVLLSLCSQSVMILTHPQCQYSGKDNLDMENSVDAIVWQMIHLIKRKYLSTPTTYRRLDLAQTIQYFTLDVITSLSMTEPFGFIENDTDVYEYIKHYRGLLPQMQFMTSVPILNRLMRVPAFKRLSTWFLGDRVGIGKTKQVAREIISKRFGEGAEVRQDMIGSFIKNGLSLQECADESLIQIFAGSDTTSTTIRTLMMNIISHYPVQKKLLEEIQSVGIPLTEIISNKRAKELPYLQACISEALRVFPSAAGLILKNPPPEGDTLPDGTFIPGKTAIGLCAWGVHRNKEVYGEDAKLFRPERWFEAEGERLARMKRTHEMSFGHGLYRCLGEQIAKLELNKSIFELVRRFEFTMESPSKPFEREHSYGLFLQTGMWVRVVEREMEIS